MSTLQAVESEKLLGYASKAELSGIVQSKSKQCIPGFPISIEAHSPCSYSLKLLCEQHMIGSRTRTKMTMLHQVVQG